MRIPNISYNIHVNLESVHLSAHGSLILSVKFALPVNVGQQSNLKGNPYELQEK